MSHYGSKEGRIPTVYVYICASLSYKKKDVAGLVAYTNRHSSYNDMFVR
jgi:hypothetical protein